MSTLLPPAGRRSYWPIQWIGLFLLAATLCLPTITLASAGDVSDGDNFNNLSTTAASFGSLWATVGVTRTIDKTVSEAGAGAYGFYSTRYLRGLMGALRELADDDDGDCEEEDGSSSSAGKGASSDDDGECGCKEEEDSGSSMAGKGASDHGDDDGCVTIDYGDNPDTYGTLAVSDGARHVIVPNTVVLGLIVDSEPDGMPGIESNRDDTTGTNDDDGVLFPGFGKNECPAGAIMGLVITYTSDSTNVWLDAFADWDDDGVFGLGETIIGTNLYDSDTLGSGVADGSATFPVLCTPGAARAATDTTLYLRFRVHVGSAPLGPTGLADNGEVEDYLAVITGTTTQQLPVELTEFGAIADDGDIVLTWATATETNNAGFVVEEIDGDEIRSLAFVEGAGTTTDQQFYRYRVMSVQPGTRQYRLKQVDFDGAFEYSPIVEIVAELPAAFVLEPAYPNPFNPTTTLRFAVQKANRVTMDLFDISGRIVKTLYEGVPDANQQITVTIDAAGLASGLYMVRLAGADFATTQTITLLK